MADLILAGHSTILRGHLPFFLPAGMGGIADDKPSCASAAETAQQSARDEAGSCGQADMPKCQRLEQSMSQGCTGLAEPGQGGQCLGPQGTRSVRPAPPRAARCPGFPAPGADRRALASTSASSWASASVASPQALRTFACSRALRLSNSATAVMLPKLFCDMQRPLLLSNEYVHQVLRFVET